MNANSLTFLAAIAFSVIGAIAGCILIWNRIKCPPQSQFDRLLTPEVKAALETLSKARAARGGN